jgi:RNA polymerase sigma factor (TIGR02999 family)
MSFADTDCRSKPAKAANAASPVGRLPAPSLSPDWRRQVPRGASVEVTQRARRWPSSRETICGPRGKLSGMTDVTRILDALGHGDPHVAAELLPLVYDELRRLAARHLAGEKPGQTLDATALVHEAYLRLVGGGPEQPWNSRGHFFAAAAEAMRRILVERARRKGRIRHGGNLRRVNLLDDEVAAPTDDEQVLLLDEALARLAAVRRQAAELVKLRFFAGLTLEEVAPLLALSPRTARRLWAFARAWLRRDMEQSDEPAS